MARAGKSIPPAQPATFTAEQVAALNAGTANMAEVAKTLKRHRQPRLRTRAKRGEKRAPIPLTAAQVRKLTSGRGTPGIVASALEASSPRPRKSHVTARKLVRPQRIPPSQGRHGRA
jgi:hypothetical protein